MNCACKIKPGKTDGPIAPKLCKIHKRIALEMIDKCTWWIERVTRQTYEHAAAKASAEEVLLHLKAGRARVARGEAFDSYSVAD